MIKVLLVDDHSIVRAGLSRIFEDCHDISLMAEAEDGVQALEKAREKNLDVAVVDLSMPGMDGLELIDRLLSLYPKLPIIVLTTHEENQYVIRAIGAGAKGYVTKRSAPKQLLEAIRKVYSGGRYLSETAAEALAVHVAGGKGNKQLLDGLSNREMQVLRRIALGQANREIANVYNVCTKTVETYRYRLLKKLNLRNNADISRFAIQNHLIEL